ncbi:putative heme utilization radical SAM enzyme HutW [Fulvitalea axinellae]|uniref:Heme utilization radical SAM enzyme HutW n=1 Tax=Fulvitalea axinellae TaxID=1182444 RepID=A0AAU9CGS4_9BACT|nr:putative heme utilization radical SAM enzyme HutW [Fulvitalea axinellae]
MTKADKKTSASDMTEHFSAMLAPLLDLPPTPGNQRVVYLHTPFCRSHCNYCPFYRHPAGKLKDFAQTTVKMIRALGQRPFVADSPFSVYFFGGGTPTILAPDDMGFLLAELTKNFRPAIGHEFTVESTLTRISPKMLDILKRNHVTRVSIGLQTFDENRRKMLGRPATRQEMVSKIKIARESGLETSLDLMYGIPGQMPEDLAEDVKLATDLGVDNISQYRLQLFDGAPLKKGIERGRISAMPSYDQVMETRLAGAQSALEAGYSHWNVKNFGKTKTTRCEYTLTPHEDRDMIPLGAGAGGQIGPKSIFTLPDADDYREAVRKGLYPVFRTGETATKQRVDRKVKGLLESGEVLLDKLAPDSVSLAYSRLEKLLEKEIVEKKDNAYRLTQGSFLDYERALDFTSSRG